MAYKVTYKIINEIKKTYFSIILDSTLYLSHTDQLSVILTLTTMSQLNTF